jgi:hypothetical protein
MKPRRLHRDTIFSMVTASDIRRRILLRRMVSPEWGRASLALLY